MSATTETLTISEKREARKEARRKVRIERQSALHHVDTIYGPQIQKLREEWREARNEINKNCDEQLKAVDKVNG